MSFVTMGGFWPMFMMNFPDWYLATFVLFYLLFNPLQNFVKKRCQVDTMCNYLKFICCIQILQIILRFTMMALGGFLLFHGWSFTHIPQFLIGLASGQAALHMPLSEAGERKLAIYTDLFLGGFCFIGAFVGIPSGMFIFMMGDAPLAVSLVGLIRTRTYIGKVFSLEFLRAFAPYTLGVYVIHTPVIFWARLMGTFGLETISDLWDFAYGDLPCWATWSHWPKSDEVAVPLFEGGCGALACKLNLLPLDCPHAAGAWASRDWEALGCDPANRTDIGYFPFAWLFIQMLSCCLGVVLTILVHDPLQRFLNQRNLRRAQRSPEVRKVAT
jgi:hypothetical protein